MCLGWFKVRIRDKNGGFLLGSKGQAAAWSWEGRSPCRLSCAEEGGRAAAWGVLGHDPCLLFGEAGPLDRGGPRHRKVGSRLLRAYLALGRF